MCILEQQKRWWWGHAVTLTRFSFPSSLPWFCLGCFFGAKILISHHWIFRRIFWTHTDLDLITFLYLPNLPNSKYITDQRGSKYLWVSESVFLPPGVHYLNVGGSDERAIEKIRVWSVWQMLSSPLCLCVCPQFVDSVLYWMSAVITLKVEFTSCLFFPI